MASPDLYVILGVPRDADPDAIKTAYRQRAKESHPDHGSDPGDFRRLKDAYDVLSDPATRAHYDETGETPAEKTAREADEARFRQLLGDLLVNTIAQSGAPAFTDIVAEARRSVLAQIGAVDSEFSSLKILSQRVAEVLLRLQEPEGETLLHTTLTERLVGIETRIVQVTETRSQLARLLEGLKDYGYVVQVDNIL